MSLFELEAVGGPWGRRLQRRRAGLSRLCWTELGDPDPAAREAARVVWTRSTFSEYASAAAFAEIASALLAVAAPIDLVAAAGDFVVDEMIHAEASARLAMALGGAVPLEVDLERLVRPASAENALLRAAELLVRTSCVGEALTVRILERARSLATAAPTIHAVLTRILKDESQHAQLGPWFLDWAAERLAATDRAHLGRIAGQALVAFVPLFADECAPGSGLGTLGCSDFDATFAGAVIHHVARPLAARGIEIPPEDLAAIQQASRRLPAG